MRRSFTLALAFVGLTLAAPVAALTLTQPGVHVSDRGSEADGLSPVSPPNPASLATIRTAGVSKPSGIGLSAGQLKSPVDQVSAQDTASNGALPASLADQPLPLQYAVSADRGQDDPSYHVLAGPNGPEATSAHQGLIASFAGNALHVQTGAIAWSIGGRLPGVSGPPRGGAEPISN